MDFEIRCVGTCSNGKKVYDRSNGHWQTAHTDVSQELVEEALQKMEISEDDEEQPMIKKEVDFDRVIGKCNCVTVTPEDKTFGAKRKGRECHSHIVINREPEDCNKLAVILRKYQDGYMLVTTYVGNLAPMEPDDPILVAERNKEKMDEAIDFWNSHALIYCREHTEYVISDEGDFLNVDEFEEKYLKKKDEVVNNKADVANTNVQNKFDIPDDALIMLMGVAASGKSSTAKGIAEKYPSEIIASDDIRDEMFAKEIKNKDTKLVYSPESKAMVYDQMAKRVEENMKAGKRTIADATFLFEQGEKTRRKLFDICEKYNRPLRVVILKTPVELAEKLDSNRERKVGPEVIEKMWKYLDSTYDSIVSEIDEMPNAKCRTVEMKNFINKEQDDDLIK